MTTNLRPSRADRIAAKLRPSWASKCARITQRLLKPDCFRCGGEDFMHSYSCTRRQSYGSSAIAFGNAVIRAEARHAQYLRNEALMMKLKRALTPHTFGPEVES
jgi:hypothetical protein